MLALSIAISQSVIMPKPFAAFDVDGTIFKSSLAEKVVEGCIEEGVFPSEPFDAVYANKRRWHVNNNEGVYQAYLHRLVGTFVEQMAGVEVERFDQVTEKMLQQQAVRKFGFPRMLMRRIQASHFLLAISGSPNILVEPFLRDLDISTTFGSEFEVEDGRFTGEASSVGNKAVLLKGLVERGDVLREGSVAMGDTIGDVPMLEYADVPLMFNASRTLTGYGSEFGWTRINEVKDQITVLCWDEATGIYVERSPGDLFDDVSQSLAS